MNMAIKKKSLTGAAASKPKEASGARDQKSEQPVRPAAAKKLAVAKLATAKLVTAKLALLRRIT
jgi:hypothetical protein